MEQTCENCRWFKLDGERAGLCLLTPPEPLRVGESMVISSRGRTRKDFTCREFAPYYEKYGLTLTVHRYTKTGESYAQGGKIRERWILKLDSVDIADGDKEYVLAELSAVVQLLEKMD